MLIKSETAKEQIPGLELVESGKEGLLQGVRKNGIVLSVRKHRKHFLMPDTWKKMMDALPTNKAKLTAEILIQTGARINEARHVQEKDLDYDRNTIRLRFVKTKARKKGEERGGQRIIAINSNYIKKLRKHFRDLPIGAEVGILSTSAFRQAMQKALKKIGIEDYYNYSAHSIKKTHGNWLSAMDSFGLMKCGMQQICQRLGDDSNTYLKYYGSSNIMNATDAVIIKEIFWDLYANRMI